MEERVDLAKRKFNDYVNSFSELREDQKKILEIKRNHSIRVADSIEMLARKKELNENEIYLSYLIGLFHDIGRFKQLREFDTFNDSKSVDHAEYSLEVLKSGSFLDDLDEGEKQLVLFAIAQHNKLVLPKKNRDKERLFARLIRDADKLDILNVITDYYSNPTTAPNHTLTWELPTGTKISDKVLKQILNEELVSKDEVKSELDIKVMQLSWVYDLNFRPSFELMAEKRYLEKIYNSMPKNDTVIEIYRKVKVYIENKFIK
ncbi:MAG TPA: HD domain-containing protein [Draconibacterium sp.]|nr:HD domain-containing protein [Draconibacterium sp.]